nr:MAG TPA: hypothetical protein [Caudoviricetes sp.]
MVLFRSTLNQENFYFSHSPITILYKFLHSLYHIFYQN